MNTPHGRGTADPGGPGGISGAGPGYGHGHGQGHGYGHGHGHGHGHGAGSGSGTGSGPGSGSGSGSGSGFGSGFAYGTGSGHGTGASGGFRILHVSTGNVCRSPLTERLTRHALKERLGDGRCGGIVVESAGTWGHEGAPMEEHAAEVLLEHGADPEGFRGRELLDEHVIRADLVLTATRDHRAQVVSMGHSAGLRTFTLKEFTRLVRAIDAATLPDPRSAEGVVERAYALVQAAAALRGWLLAPSPEADEIHDPYGAPIPYFRSVGDEISKALDPVVTALTGVQAGSRPHT